MTSSSFPTHRFDDPARYAEEYFRLLSVASATIHPESLRSAATLLTGAIQDGAWIYACGNGGSAAISNHLHCDFSKGIRTGTAYFPRINSLAANLETITAIGNDIGYDDVFSYQLSGIGKPSDVLITVSSSGNSENIVRSLRWARDNGMHTIALTGFDGGRSATLADVNIHVEAYNYGIVEDIHQSVMHILAQFVRQAAMTQEDVANVKF